MQNELFVAGAELATAPAAAKRLEAGESMPPKSTYFYPKIPTGLVFNVLE